MIRSLRLRLLLGTSLATAVVLALLGGAVYYFTWRSLTAQFDAAMLVKAKAIASMVEQDGTKVIFDFDPKDMPEFQPGKHKEYFEVWMDDGSVLAKSLSLGNGDLARGKSDDTPIAILLPDGHHGRAMTISLAAKNQRDEDDPNAKPVKTRSATLTVAMPIKPLAETLEQLAGILFVTCGAAVVVSGVTLLWVVGRGLRPVGRLAREIEAIGAPELSQRLQSAGAPTELVPVVEKLNNLLDRLSTAFAREKAFTADAAHELRTPLAGLQATLEVCRSRPRERAEYESAIDKCTAIVTRMEAMVTSLLMLSRAEAGQLHVECKTFDVCALIDDCLTLLRERVERRRLIVEQNAPGQCDTTGDTDKLRIILQNLLDNAVSHANEDGRIRIEVQPADHRVTVKITNSGSQIAAADVQHLFERFWRGDESRTDAGLHCGLGLSLCQRLTALMGGEILAESTMGGDFSVRLILPR